MTTVIHHGAPGSYKTFSIVQNILVDALKAGRLVITNIRGFDSIEKVKNSLALEFPSSSQIWYIEPDDDGFKTMATFFHWAPAGALIAMDEGQRIYPTRNRRFDDLDLPSDVQILDAHDKPLINSETQQLILRPKTVEIAFDQHRHFNWDIYISTPNISKIHKEIRHVVEWAYRHRNNTGLLPWYKNTWTEFRHDAENNGKSISHYSGSPKRYKAQPKFFGCYQSTATGTAQASNENISIFRDTRLRIMLGIIILCVSYLGYSLHAAYSRVHPKTVASSVPVGDSIPAQVVHPVADVPAVIAGAKALPPVDIPVVDPLHDAKIFYVGVINNQPLFEVQFTVKNIQSLQFSYDDLRYFGYQIKYKSQSFIVLEHLGKTIYAFAKPNDPLTPAREPVEQALAIPAGVGFIASGRQM